jgi:hypothetical protein
MMTTTQSIFVVFFAIFWGAIASVQGRWKMFHWPLIRYCHVAARIGLSVALLNILPLLFFAWIFFLLRNTPTTTISQWSGSQTLLQILAGIAPAFAVFGFYRLWLAAVEFFPTAFYQRRKGQDRLIRKIEPTLDTLNLRSEFAPWNLFFALMYLVVAGGVPWLLVR